MGDIDLKSWVNRRRLVTLGGGLAGGLIMAGTGARAGLAPPRSITGAQPDAADMPGLALAAAGAGTLPVKQIEAILQGPGTVSGDVLQVSLDRSDIGTVKGPLGVAFKAPFELTHDLYFQSLGGNKAIMNAEATLLPQETNPFIDALLQHGLVFQAFHQHYVELAPQVWHIHFRGIGDALALARAAAAAIKVTATPLPQSEPSHSTPLNADELAHILGGDAEVEDGVVIVSVPRKDRIRLGGVTISPELGVAHEIEFEPLSGAKKAAAAPDFSLVASEINPVMKLMRQQGFFIGCLYNQETDEQPQLYFSHQLAVGDPYDLARKIRKGLDLTSTAFTA